MVGKCEYDFFFQGVEKKDDSWELIPSTLKNLETDFYGCIRYSKAEGINTIGKAKIYTESYADSDEKRVYVPDTVTNESTKVIFTLYFFGEYRHKAYDEFNEYIRNGVHKYWDTARNKYFLFVVSDEIKISSEKWYGSMPYFEVKYTVQNINGKTFSIED